MIKRIVIFSLVATLMLIFSPALAQKPDTDSDLPEIDGTYDVPGHPDLKLRVFVYKEKPTISPALALTCNISDPNSTAIDATAGWTLPSSWTYSLNTSSVPASVGTSNWPSIANKAFASWSSQISGKVSIVRGSDTTVSRAVRDGKNIVTFGKASGSALAVTYTWYNTSTKKAVEIDTIMNNRFSWAWSDPSSWGNQPTCAFLGVYDAQDILTHELGHTFGLNDHYTSVYSNNTMYGYGSKTETKKDTLTSGDISGIKILY